MNKKVKNKFVKVYTKSRKRILFDNLLGGIAWGVGSVIGATIIIWILSFIFIKSQKIPLLGDLVRQVVEEASDSTEETKEILNGD